MGCEHPARVSQTQREQEMPWGSYNIQITRKKRSKT